MANPGEYGQWYFLIYLLPGGIALLLLLLSALSGGAHHHGSGGAGHGHHGGVGHHAHHPAGQAHHAHHSAAGPGAGRQMLAWFGIGRVPALFLWGSALLGWGLFGFWGTQLWQSHLHRPTLFVLPALATALLGAFVTEKVTAEAAARLLPQERSTATGTVELCGLTGTVAYPVDAQRGRIHVYDTFGTLHDVQARTMPGQTQIARGRKVLVTDYQAARDTLIVEDVA